MDERELWIASGGYKLTGRRDGPPRHAPGAPATAVHENLAVLAGAALTGRLPTVDLISQRARLAGLSRNGPASCGGAFRPLRARDGWVGLSLARPSDLELLPALIGGEVSDAWPDVADWARDTPAAAADRAIQELGLPGGRIPDEPPTDRPAVVTTVLGRRAVRAEPLVVDLTSLWAGPLCARLLGLTGARIIKVESTDRPDGARLGSPEFFRRLHQGHERRTLDFRSRPDLLRDLLAQADLVLEASRPRALAQLGIEAASLVAAGTSWLSITARGRDSGTVGFGDDVAACAGMVLRDGDGVLPVGDALADPLTGVRAAVAALDALASDEARLVDVSMLHTVAETL